MKKLILILGIAFLCISMSICEWETFMMPGYDHGYKDALIRVYQECDGCFPIDSVMMQFPIDSSEFRASFLGGF